MNWWYAIDDKDNELWILVERWFNARAFALSKLGEKVVVTNNGGIPKAACFEQGKVFKGTWTKHDAAPNSNLNFIQLDVNFYIEDFKAKEKERLKKLKAKEEQKKK